MISTYFKTIKDKKFKSISAQRPGSWLVVESAEKEDLEKIAELTGLSYADLQDSLDTYEVPRMERQEEGTLMYVRYPSQQDEDLHTALLTFIVTDKYFISISPNKNEIIRSVLDKSTKHATTQKSKLLIEILLRVAQEFTVKVKSTTSKVPRGRRELKRVDSEDFIILVESEEILNQYISALVPMSTAIGLLATKKYINMYESDEDLLQDLLIGIRQSVDICNVSLKSIKSVRESYQIIATNNLNKVIRLLTSLTIVLTVPTIIASIYGMNVVLPLAEDPLAFFYIIWTILGISAVVLFFFFLKKWL